MKIDDLKRFSATSVHEVAALQVVVLRPVDPSRIGPSHLGEELRRERKLEADEEIRFVFCPSPSVPSLAWDYLQHGMHLSYRKVSPFVQLTLYPPQGVDETVYA